MRLTLDDLEQERAEDEHEPFEVGIAADLVISLPHPKDMPFEVLVNFDGTQPAAVLRALMGDDGFDQLVAAKDANGKTRVTLGILETILLRYYKHYGLGAPGEGVASLRSSSGSARRSKPTSRRKATA